jgi:hypothetical protein
MGAIWSGIEKKQVSAYGIEWYGTLMAHLNGVTPSLRHVYDWHTLGKPCELACSLQVCLGKSTQEALLGSVYLPDLLQFCLKSYRLAAANCEIMQVS